MANEAVLMYETELPIPFIVADGTGITKGAWLAVSDPMTAATHTAANQSVAGIAQSQKIASDGVTTLGVYRGGIFKVTLSGACVVGDALALDASINHVKRVSANMSGSKVVGYALETGATGETIVMELNISAGGVA